MPIPFGPNVVVAGRFRLNRQLGRGGMGSVWHATHLGLDVPCAVKFIEGEIAALPEAQARFEREAKAAAQLRSPHVVQILDHGVWEGLPYIAMELLEGEDLGKRLTRIGRMGPFEVVRIINQVARALTRAHAAGVVHRDLKPDNIFLVRDEDREIAKVLDFGIAKASGNTIQGSTTKTGAMLGTPYYMSPEQAQGTKAVDHRSDLWSLGVIVFQALTGKLPFESEALGDLLIKIIVSPIPNPSDFVNDLAPAFDRWWQKASHRDPALRWQSSKELAEGLGLVFGLTPGASVVEAPGRMSYGAEVGAFQQGMPGAPTGPGAYAYGGGHVPAFAQTPGLHPQHAPFGLTPSQPGVPMPFGLTPSQPGVPMPYGSSQPGVPTTGTPLSRSVGGTPEIPKQSRAALWVSLGVAGALAAVAIVVGVSVAGRGKHPIADVPAASATAAPGAATATNAVPPLATESLVPPAETAAAAAHPSASAALASPEASAQASKPAKPGWVAPPVQAPPAKAPPAAQPPTAPAKPAHQPKPAVDLGI
jgi:serine/threonine-protein kinase